MPGLRGISYVRKNNRPMEMVIDRRACPYCKAQIGELCRVVATGKPITGIGQVHDARLKGRNEKKTKLMADHYAAL